MNFSLIIPCFNEAKNIPLLIDKYRDFVKDKKNQLVLVNNGSTDNTRIIFKNLKKSNIKTHNIKKNIGYGYGLKRGIKVADGKVLIISHADLEVDPKDIIKSIKIYKKQNSKIKKKIFIKGHRVNKIKNSWTFMDIFFSYGLTIISSLIFRKNLYDIHAQPVLFNKEILRKFKYFPNDFSVDLIFYLYAKRLNYKIIRFPVNFDKKKRIHGIGSSGTFIRKFQSSLEQFVQCFVILFRL